MTKVVLLYAQAFHRSKPESFPYAPSESALDSLRPGMTVRLLAMPIVPGEGGDLWEAKPLWAEIEDRREQGFRATVKVGAPWPGFMEGEVVEFSADRVFDFYGPEQWFNPERLPSLTGGDRRLLRGSGRDCTDRRPQSPRPALLGFAGALFGLFTFQKAMLNGSPRAAVVAVACVSVAVVVVFWNPFGELFRIGELIVATIACGTAILLPGHREATESD